MIIVRNNHALELDPATGVAALRPVSDANPVWTGTVLPALHVQRDGVRSVLHARGSARAQSEDEIRLDLDFGGRASGSAVFRSTPHGAELADVEIDLGGLALVDLFFGLSPLSDEQRTRVADPEYPEWPDFRSAALCVPSARPAPPASILRRWDLGQATVPLGLYGPSLGSPYAAAFPRPVYAAAFGDDRGWLLAGAGEIPDAALTLEMRGTSGAIRWRYREDLWAPPAGPRRWAAPLRLTWGATAVEAFAEYFATFGPRARDASTSATAAHWNSWGDHRRGEFRLDEVLAASKDLEADVYVIDDGWESSVSSGIPNPERFPDMRATADEVRAAGLEIGFWQSVGWVEDLEEAGLGPEDLIQGADGAPRTSNWGMDPRDVPRFSLDPSSARTRAFLEERMRRIVREYRPRVVKLDFGYGLPGPDVGVPSDPAYRGERLGDALYRILSDAAHAEDPDVLIQLYGIHPLHTEIADLVALDDMGDHGDHAEAEGHRHWSVWAALMGSQGVAVNGSSGYHWAQDGEVVLDTAVLGAPGAVLALLDARQQPTARERARRRAINRWHRRTVRWSPLWLDSELGRVDVQPGVVSWGRVEPGGVLAALCLRAESSGRLDAHELGGMLHSGDWAVIAQDEGDLRSDGARLAAIPVGAGELRLPGRGGARVTRWVAGAPSEEQATLDGDVLVLVADDGALDGGLEGWVVENA